MSNTAKLVTQLRTLHALTQTEAQIAEARVAQARTDAVRRELEQNAANARERARLLVETIGELGGVPDVVSPTLGRVSGLLKTTLEQAAAFDEALLQDLGLEHQLLDRARYLKVLAQAAQQPKVAKVAQRLITAHTATVEWLTVVLAEEALGGPAALQATPLQRVAGGATRALNLPARAAAEGVNRAVHGVAQTGKQARTKLAAGAAKATQLTGAAREAVTVGRDASLQRAETIARREGDRDAAAALRSARSDAGALTPKELPVPGYDELNAQEAIKAIKQLTDVDDLRAVMRYEQAHANRSSVLTAAQAHVAALAKQAAGIS
jgi:hypothetical protein